MGKIKSFNKIIRPFGIEIMKFHHGVHPMARKKKILEEFNINLVLDVGANFGSFGFDLRDLNYKGRIVSFEPVKEIFNNLNANTKKDNKWTAYNYALGKENTELEINISKNTYSSSILEMEKNHLNAAPQSAYISTEKITLKTLDSILNSISEENDNIYLKLDTQGYEKEILEGASTSLKRIKTIQLEMSLIPLYKNETSFIEMYNYLTSSNFEPISIEPGFSDPNTGRVLQVDGIFHNYQ